MLDEDLAFFYKVIFLVFWQACDATISFLIQLLFHADLASNWLSCFPLSARVHVYDVFFVEGLVTEVVQTLVPCLQQNASDGHDLNSVHTNTER